MSNLLSNAIRRCNPTHVFRVSDLDPNIRLWRVYVKVLRKFNHINGNTQTLDFILVDHKGDKIHATLEKDIENDALHVLKEGDWTVLENFDLERVQGGFRPTAHGYKIKLISGMCATTIPYRGTCNFFSFAGFEDIHSDMCDPDHCVDLIGHVLSVGNFLTRSQPFDHKKRRGDMSMLLSNGKGARLSVILRMDYAEAFLDKFTECSNSIVICIVRFARIFKVNGFWKAMTVYECSQLMINPPFPEVDQLRRLITQPHN